jgi:hypothetical protein
MQAETYANLEDQPYLHSFELPPDSSPESLERFLHIRYSGPMADVTGVLIDNILAIGHLITRPSSRSSRVLRGG